MMSSWLGTIARRRSRFAHLRTGMLTAAALIFILAGISLWATVATYSGWDKRSDARSPRAAELFPAEDPALLWDFVWEDLDGIKPVAVVYIAPLREDAPLPPGVRSWPAPGEAFMSPALARSGAAYGTTVGLIGPEGLVDAGELLVYRGALPQDLDDDHATLSTGFGTNRFQHFGAIAYRKPLATFLAVQVTLLVVPALWFVVTALRVGAGERARRAHIVTVLGGTTSSVRRMLWGESRFPILSGAAMAIGVAAALPFTDLALPGARFALRGADLRTGGAFLVLAILVATGVLALMGSSRLGLRRDRFEPGSRSLAGDSFSLLRGTGSFVAAALTVIGANLAVGANLFDLVVPIVGVGSLVTMALLPMACVAWLQHAALRGRRAAWRSGQPGALVGAAQVAARPRPAARFGATAAIMIVFLTLVYNALTSVSEETRAAMSAQKEIGEAVATIRPIATADEEWIAALTELGREYAIAGLSSVEPGVTSVTAAPASLEVLGLGRGDGPVPSWLTYIAGVTVAVSPSDEGVAREVAEVLVVAPLEGGSVDLEALRTLLASTTTPTWTAQWPGQEFLVGSEVAIDQARWLTWFGGLGMLTALLALWCTYANELIRAMRSLLVVQMIAPDDSLLRSALAWRILAPVGVAVLGGGGVALILSIPASVQGAASGFGLPLGFLTFCSVLALASGGVAWVVTYVNCRSAAGSLGVGMGIAEE